jgi:hypothetical protein
LCPDQDLGSPPAVTYAHYTISFIHPALQIGVNLYIKSCDAILNSEASKHTVILKISKKDEESLYITKPEGGKIC